MENSYSTTRSFHQIFLHSAKIGCSVKKSFHKLAMSESVRLKLIHVYCCCRWRRRLCTFKRHVFRSLKTFVRTSLYLCWISGTWDSIWLFSFRNDTIVDLSANKHLLQCLKTSIKTTETTVKLLMVFMKQSPKEKRPAFTGQQLIESIEWVDGITACHCLSNGR